MHGFTECDAPRGMLEYVTTSTPYYVVLHGWKVTPPHRVSAIQQANRQVHLDGIGWREVERIARHFHAA